MTPEEILRFREALITWFNLNQRQLPWRQTVDPYLIWISEVMLQQTQVRKVLEYYQKFIGRFPDVRRLAEADLQEVLKSWERMGYYARARNLHAAARIIAEGMGGEIPANYQAFRELPGVGDYIAAAVQSLAFNKPFAVVDGNVKRVLARLLLIDSPINRSSSAKIFRRSADLLLNRERPRPHNQGMMELGATLCRPQRPLCPDCPVFLFCRARQANLTHRYPVRTRGRVLPEFHIATAVIQRDGHVLITQRKSTGLLGGLWEFPGGKVREAETPEEACIREVKEEVDLSVEITSFVGRVKHAYTHFKIIMDVFFCRYVSGEVTLNGPVDHQWIRLDEIDRFPLPGANHKFIPLLRECEARGTCSL